MIAPNRIKFQKIFSNFLVTVKRKKAPPARSAFFGKEI